MYITSFSDFIKSYSFFAKHEHDFQARHIYENIIWRNDTRIRMALVSLMGLPALDPVIPEIEAYCRANHYENNLRDLNVRSAIGSMAKAALEPLGFVVVDRRPLSDTEFFDRAAVYQLKPGAELAFTFRVERGELSANFSEEAFTMAGLSSTPFAGPLKDNDALRHIDEHIICREDVKLKFLLYSELHIPALAACVKEIEDFCEQNPDCGVDLNDLHTKQLIGRLIRNVMVDALGCEVASTGNRLPAAAGSKYFSTAAAYQRRADVQMEVTLRCTGAEEETLSHTFQGGEFIGL